MTPIQLAKIWTAVSLFLLYYLLNAWLVSQGGSEIFGAKLIAPGRVLAVVTAIPICSIMLVITSMTGRIYALREGSTWHRRIPVVGFDDIRTGSREGRIYQAGMLFAFSVFPRLGMVHFCREALSARIVSNDDNASVIETIWDWKALTSLSNPASMCNHYDLSATPPCVDGFTVLPGLQPTVLAILVMAALAGTIAHWKAILR